MIRSVYPIICPPKQFRDNTGRENAYLDMNPSLHIEPDGRATVLVRRVNYRKFPWNKFTLYEGKSISEYTIFRGKLEAGSPFSLEGFTCNDLRVDYGETATHNTYWLGPEDIRFLDAGSVLATVPELNANGQPCVFQARLKGGILSRFERCEPSVTEKNWMPFGPGGKSVIYSLDPLVVKSVGADDREEVVTDERLEGYHGSTNGIAWGGGYLFLVHKNCGNKTEHRWMLLSDGNVALSEPFTFFPHSYIEFPCSLVEWDRRFFVSLGVNDDKAYIVEVGLDDLAKRLS